MTIPVDTYFMLFYLTIAIVLLAIGLFVYLGTEGSRKSQRHK